MCTHCRRNRAARDELESCSKRGTAAQQQHAKLQRQLADATAQAALLQQLIAVEQETTQQAMSLAEQLQLQDDAEELALSEAPKQLEQLQRPQQSAPVPTSATSTAEAAGQWLCSADATCSNPTCVSCTVSEEEATEILKQLSSELAAGMRRLAGDYPSMAQHCRGDAAADQQRCSENENTRSSFGKWQWLLQQITDLMASNAAQFKRCTLANHLLAAQLKNPLLQLRCCPSGQPVQPEAATAAAGSEPGEQMLPEAVAFNGPALAECEMAH